VVFKACRGNHIINYNKSAANIIKVLFEDSLDSTSKQFQHRMLMAINNLPAVFQGGCREYQHTDAVSVFVT
jgi:hypothetical protein